MLDNHGLRDLLSVSSGGQRGSRSVCLSVRSGPIPKSSAEKRSGHMREHKPEVVSVIGLLLLLLNSWLVWAQLPTATVLGVVKDTSDAVVPSAKLTAVNTETGQNRNAT